MTKVSQPEVTLNIQSANQLVGVSDQKVLIVGQQTAAGTATSGALEVGIQNDNSWDTLYGANSILAKMIRDFRAINQEVQVDAIGLADNGAGVAATGTIAFTGPATEDGTLTVIIGSKTNHSYDIAITSGDTATNIGDALDVLIAADTEVPVTSANVTGTVTFTAVNKGTIGNDIGIKVEGSVAGVGATVTGMASGATDPTLTSVFDVVGDKRYQTIVWSFVGDLTTLKNFLDPRFNATNQVLDGVGIVTLEDSSANLITTANTHNSQSLAILGDEAISTSLFAGPAMLELAYSKSSQFAAIRSLRLQTDANISQYVISRNGALDSFGGPALASKPYFNTPFPSLPLIDTGDGFTRVEVENLLDAGVWVIGNNVGGTSAIAGEVVTTYKTDSASNPDISFKFLNYVDTISTIREFYFNNLKARFAQTRLTEGDLIRGRDMANQELIEAFCTQLYTTLSESDYVLTQAGETALQFYIQNLSVTLDLSLGKVTIIMQVPIVTQLRQIIATVQIAFSTEG